MYHKATSTSTLPTNNVNFKNITYLISSFFRILQEKDETVKKNKEEIEQLTKDLESR